MDYLKQQLDTYFDLESFKNKAVTKIIHDITNDAALLSRFAFVVNTSWESVMYHCEKTFTSHLVLLFTDISPSSWYNQLDLNTVSRQLRYEL